MESAQNLADLEEPPPKVRRSMTFVPVESMDEVLATALATKENGAGAPCGEGDPPNQPGAGETIVLGIRKNETRPGGDQVLSP